MIGLQVVVVGGDYDEGDDSELLLLSRVIVHFTRLVFVVVVDSVAQVCSLVKLGQ